MLERFIKNKIEDAFLHFKAVYVTGARQVGKTTLVKHIAQKRNLTYVTLDDNDTLKFANDFPGSFFEKYTPPLVIDEVQSSTELIMQIKQLLDQTTDSGKLLLTGSADFMRNKKIRESLAGRFISVKMYPLSQSEINLAEKSWFETLISNSLDFQDTRISLDNLADILYRGSFPSIRLSNMPLYLIKSWFDDYLEARILKDIRLLDEIRKSDKIRQLLKIMAWQSGSLLNISNLASSTGVSLYTLEKYFALLEGIFLVERLRPYFKNLQKRVVKQPKVYLIDTGLMSYLNQLTFDDILEDRTMLGKLVETWVYSELQKEISYSQQVYELYFYRDDKKNELDFLIEKSDKKLIGIEVKAKEAVRDDDLRSINAVCRKLGGKLEAVYIIYLGNKFLPLKGDCPIWLLPIANLISYRS